MDRMEKEIDDLTRSIGRLGPQPWNYNCASWGLVSQKSTNTFIALICSEGKNKYGQIKIFPSIQMYKRFILDLQEASSDRSIYAAHDLAEEYTHLQVMIRGGDTPGMIEYRDEGSPSRPLKPSEFPLYRELVKQCSGVMMRLCERPNFLLEYQKKGRLFARKEISENHWVDGPLDPHMNEPFMQAQIVLKKKDCQPAQKLPVYPNEVWHVMFQFNEETFRRRGGAEHYYYNFVAVVANEPTRFPFCEFLKRDSKRDGQAMLRLYESLPGRLLNAFLHVNYVPGTIVVNSMRTMRFLQPLCMQLPFKLTYEADLSQSRRVILDHLRKLVLKATESGTPF